MQIIADKPSDDSRTLARRKFISSLVSLGESRPRAACSDGARSFAWADSSAARYIAAWALRPWRVIRRRPTSSCSPTGRRNWKRRCATLQTDLTPNDAFFVRWHLSGIPTTVDLQTFRLEVGGHVSKPMSLSLSELRSKFEPVSLVALAQCAGNFRSLFEPRVAGGQWGSGAMGNARWKGVRLKDVLDAAGVKPGAVQVGLRGLDVPPLATTPVFQKSLEIDHARDGEVMIAYEMNGEPLPMLNGYPIRLIVPGWYATYWVKSLATITVLDQPLKTFWMDKAYRIPDNPQANEEPQHLATATVPINRMPVHSIFVKPEPGEQLRAGKRYQLAGIGERWRLRHSSRRGLERWRPELERRHTRPGPGQVFVAPMAGGLDSGGEGNLSS